MRGLIDRLFGGGWLRRGRRHPTAWLRPRGLFGRLYWYAMLPFHHFIFRGMLEAIVAAGESRGSETTSPKGVQFTTI